MSGEFLDRPRRRAAHRQMRAERVPEDVQARTLHLRATRHPPHQSLHDLLGEAASIVVAQDTRTQEMAVVT